MSERDEHKLDALRRDYARLPKPEPSAQVDAAIRAAARAPATRRRLRVWSAALASAACIGLAVVLVPALLVEAPVPVLEQREADLFISVAREKAERPAVEENAARKARERAAMPMIAAPAPPASDALVVPDLDTLRAELATADEAAWRRRILALRATGHETLADALLGDFRARFSRPDSFTLDDLAREETRHP